ncbi:bifunctional 4-carboxymuconolactone decarboxylase/3-oxoadipate enol-lactonase PcaCD [Advenella mimigardefordensis]|uniref:Putative alpha/beta hydrolase fold domain-containing carboxymuconolactone decarboxylase n=1 Tax=Advenella mimigardefordensis (strain DSM 17166 / LMG 22922 / DPN7) TaxID=1247726 RepID=W0PAA7_ADVMD|nr:alpha/beta fold hydrolase [Advenella mimigardefordensis]AHG62345.1 putative alpha/beta hydrolase fold domain-containing carboxymuconolactone decarboxylase [Advenella mimigardefordensis DPN7]
MSFDPVDHNLERGLKNRRRILGDAWVERSLNGANDFNAEFQQLISRFAWHEIWSRPGLDHKTRRIIVLSITIAMGRWEEFELHVRAALTSEEPSRMTPDELKEVLMQAAIYAGVPAANTAFSHAMAILKEVGPQIGYAPQAFSPLDVSHSGTGQEGRTASKPALHYTLRRARNGKAKNTVVLSHALGCDLTMWDRLASELAADHDVIAYDHRGHGSSDAPEGLYQMAELAEDAARLLRELDCGPVIWIGLSMGAMVGQELALRHPELLVALVIANSTSGYPQAARDNWRQRIATVREQGVEAIADAVMQRYFHDTFRSEHAGEVAAYRRRLLTTDIEGYIGCCNAVGTVDTTDRLKNLSLPVLVIAGRLDQGAPLEMSEIMTREIAGAQLVVLEDASHIAVVEQPETFAAAVKQFVNKQRQ